MEIPRATIVSLGRLPTVDHMVRFVEVYARCTGFALGRLVFAQRQKSKNDYDSRIVMVVVIIVMFGVYLATGGKA